MTLVSEIELFLKSHLQIIYFDINSVLIQKHSIRSSINSETLINI
jgi:hypothetical protein